MATKSMNLISLMNYAWERRTSDSSERLQEQARNLLSHAYARIQSLVNEESKERLFIIFQHLFVFLIKSDGQHLQGEYDTYCKFCNWAGYEPLSVSDVNATYDRLTTDHLVRDINELKRYRDSIDPSEYEAMVLAFCYLSLMGDKSFDENEYYILRLFFDGGYDYAPASWEEFKREWN